MKNLMLYTLLLGTGTLLAFPSNRLAAAEAGLFIRPQLQVLFPKDIKEGLVIDLEAGFMAEDDDWSGSLDGGFYSSRDGDVEVQFVELNARIAGRWYLNSCIGPWEWTCFHHNLGFVVGGFGGYRWLTLTPGAGQKDFKFAGPHFGLEVGPIFRLDDNFSIEVPVAYGFNTTEADEDAELVTPDLDLNAFSARLALRYVFR